MADDMGFSDVGCFGGEIETPHLDRLAYSGVRFTHAYNTSRCCPTRATLLTGLSQHQVGYGSMDSDLGYPSYQGRFREGVVTVAQLLQEAEYDRFACMLRVLALHADDHLGQLRCLCEED